MFNALRDLYYWRGHNGFEMDMIVMDEPMMPSLDVCNDTSTKSLGYELWGQYVDNISLSNDMMNMEHFLFNVERYLHGGFSKLL